MLENAANRCLLARLATLDGAPSGSAKRPAVRLGNRDIPIKRFLQEPPKLTSITITGLRTYGYHGLFEEERSLGQRFTFDVSAMLRDVRTHRSDDLNCSVRYDAVVEATVEIASSARFQTLETLGEAIAESLLQRFAMIDSVTVAVAKSSPPIAHSVDRVGVQVGLRRADLIAELNNTSRVNV